METQTARDCRPAGQERPIVNDSKGLNHQRPKPMARFSRHARRRGIVIHISSGVSMTKLAYAVPAAAVCLAAIAVSAQPAAITIVLTGQSMIRSDLRTAKPPAVPAIKALLDGDVIFTNLEAAIAQPGETAQEGRGFLTPPQALDALTAMGFNLLALSGNHAFDLKDTGIRNTLREVTRRKIVHAGTGLNLAEASGAVYLQTSKGTIALIASASGLIAPGGRATADRPGVNELRVKAGDHDNEAAQDLPGAPGNVPHPEDAARILESIRNARARADVVIVYQHNHVFANLAFSTLFTEGMPERLPPHLWVVKMTAPGNQRRARNTRM